MVKKQTPCPISFNSNNPLDLEGNVNILMVVCPEFIQTTSLTLGS